MKDKFVKIGLIVLAVFSVCFASVKAENYTTTVIQEYTNKVNVGTFYNNTEYDAICINNISCNNKQLWISFNNGGAFNYESANGNSNMVCGFYDGIYYSTSSACTIQLVGIKFNQYTSLQCQTEYSLIPIEEVDSSYCQSNNLCPSCGSPSDCPNVGVSNLFINDIFHPGAFNIIMNIPEEIDWDYAYTNSGSNINIDVVGYNQDTEYINGLIDVQSYQPTTDDFTKVFTNFGNFGGLLIACLFIILVFYFVKKIFK